MRSKSSVFNKLESGLTAISMASLFIMMLIITADVGGRFIFNRPLIGGQEIVEMLMVVSVFFSISYTQKQKAHVGMELLLESMDAKGKGRYIHLVNSAIGLMVCIALSVFAFLQSIQMWERGTLSIYLQWPMWWLPICVSLGTLFLGLRLVIEVKDYIRN